MILRIRTQRVVDYPKEKRVVPMTATATRVNPDQLTYRKCKYVKKETCYSIQCDYSKS